ncbi:hypothetical protein PSY31_21860, partial [Shigella flexneri]|nr:hypothetical protein [Shigella flexneri]
MNYLQNNQGPYKSDGRMNQQQGSYQGYQNFNMRRNDHPGFSWSNNQQVQNPQHQKQPYQGPPKSSTEELIHKLAVSATNTKQILDDFMVESKAHMQTQSVAMRNLEIQVGQLAKQVSERPQGSLPGDTETNPREQCKAIMLRSGKEVVSEPEQRPMKRHESARELER